VKENVSLNGNEAALFSLFAEEDMNSSNAHICEEGR
jgi:hypothetical protein